MSGAVLGMRTYGSAALSMAKVLSGHAVAYFSNISPWDYAAGKIMGEKLGYLTLTMTGQNLNFKDRQYIMMLPQTKLEEFKSLLELPTCP